MVRAFRVFTAHYHVCLWNHTKQEVTHTLVNGHMRVCLTDRFLHHEIIS